MTSQHTAQRQDWQLAIAITVVAMVAFSVLAWWRLAWFDMTAFDAGIFDNVLWRLANGHSDVTAITGVHHFSDHLSLLMLLAVPVYAIAPGLGLPVLIVGQAVSVALVPLAAWLLADHLGLDRRTRLTILLVTAVGAGTWNAALIDVHEVGLAVGPLAMTVAMAKRNLPLRSYWVWPLLAAAARLDIAFSVLLIGLLLRRDRPRHSRLVIIIGSVMATAMAAWLVLNPWEGTSFGFHFAHLGIDAATDLPGAALRDPLGTLEPLVDPGMWATWAIWIVGFGFAAPMVGWRWVLPALPTVAIPMLGSWPQADEPHLHYWHVLLPMLAIAMVTGLANRANLRKHFFYAAVIGVAVTWLFMGIFKPPFGNDVADERAVVEYLESHPDKSVAAVGYIVPHVSRRQTVMQLPTPFACPTTPIAHFAGPSAAPDLVALPSLVLVSPATPAAERVVTMLTLHYERVATFGDHEIWQARGTVPPEAYDIVCGASAENSS